MTPEIKTNKEAPAWAASAQASGLGSGASPSHEIYEVYSTEYNLTVRTRNPLRTLEKVTKHGFPAYLKLGAGWVLLQPEDVKHLLADDEVIAPYMLEPPTFKGCKAYSYVRLSASSLNKVRTG